MNMYLIRQHFTAYSRWQENIVEEMSKRKFVCYLAKDKELELQQCIDIDKKTTLYVKYIIDEEKNIEIESFYSKSYKRKPVTLESEMFDEVVKKIHETLCFLEKELEKIKEENV